MLRTEPCHQALQCRICTLNWRKAAKAVVVVWNNTTYPQTLRKKTPMARVVSVLPVPKPPKPKRLQVEDDANSDLHAPKLLIRQRHGKLFDELDLSGLNMWAPELADKACWLLAEYHDVFSLDLAELGCIHSTEHTIKVTDDTPFKERFRWIPPLMVEEFRNHLREMLESGAIRPSQSAWCNAVVLVHKKDGGLCFCIDFQCLNAHTKKDSYPLPRNTRGIRKPSRCWPLFMPGSEIQILTDKDGQSIEAVYHLHCGSFGILWVW